MSYYIKVEAEEKAKEYVDKYQADKFFECATNRVFKIIPKAEADKFGSKYPVISVEKFLKWAAKDITDDLPPAEWEEYKRCKSGK